MFNDTIECFIAFNYLLAPIYGRFVNQLYSKQIVSNLKSVSLSMHRAIHNDQAAGSKEKGIWK